MNLYKTGSFGHDGLYKLLITELIQVRSFEACTRSYRSKIVHNDVK